MATLSSFDNDNSGSTAELDGNFTQCGYRINRLSVPEDVLTAGTYAIHFDASYRSLTGTTTAVVTRVSSTNVTPQWQIAGASLSGISQGMFSFEATNAATCGYLFFGRSRNATIGSHTIVTSGDVMGRISAAGSDGTKFVEAARISFLSDGTPGTDDMPGAITFATTPDGASAPSAVLTLTNDNKANFTGQVTSSSATDGIGYRAGAGGTVTQATSKSTGVTLNAVCGNITMNAAALAAGATVTFTLTNSAIAAGDLLLLNHVSGGTAGSYTFTPQTAAGSASITVRNVSAGSLSEAVVIKFAVFKGVTA